MSGVKNKQIDHDIHTVTINNGQATVSTRDGDRHLATQSSNTTYTISMDAGEVMLLIIKVSSSSTISFSGVSKTVGDLNTAANAVNLITLVKTDNQVRAYVLGED